MRVKSIGVSTVEPKRVTMHVSNAATNAVGVDVVPVSAVVVVVRLPIRFVRRKCSLNRRASRCLPFAFMSCPPLPLPLPLPLYPTRLFDLPDILFTSQSIVYYSHAVRFLSVFIVHLNVISSARRDRHIHDWRNRIMDLVQILLFQTGEEGDVRTLADSIHRLAEIGCRGKKS
jgi:hypothetical protein